MSFLSMLDTLLLGPLKLLFEVIFNVSYEYTNNLAITILMLSITINLLVLPLYMCADKMQKRTRDKEMELAPYIKHIKQTFKGDERMMMLQTFYKQNHYSPLSSLSGAVSLLLEIPFFMAAYAFLSDVAVFQGASLGPIADLSKPDALITIGSLTINLLPFLMTGFNIVASILFSKDAPLRGKIQLYALAAFFLVFLYNSPSGLLLYWTLNNLFSLIKNLFYKFKSPKTVIAYVVSVIGVAIPIILFAIGFATWKFRVFAVVVGLAMQLPLVFYWLKRKGIYKPNPNPQPAQPNKKIFILGCVFIAVMLGLLIPSAIISASATEFINSDNVSPIWYIVSSTLYATGTFVIWFSVFYWLVSPRAKALFDKVVWILGIVMFVNYMFFGTSLGNLNAMLKYDFGVSFTAWEILLNILVVGILAVGLYFIVKKFKTAVVCVLVLAIASVGTMSFVNIANASGQLNGAYDSDAISQTATIQLSKNNQNVVVIMLDRALGPYLPYILNERPDIAETFSGFTYYSNTISYGHATNYATPALLGGYEYTPVELNKRDDKLLSQKQNEANLVMPRVFTENVWGNGKEGVAKVFDPIYTNYVYNSDLSVFKDFKNISASYLTGTVEGDMKSSGVQSNMRNFFVFSLMKSMVVVLQDKIYNGGKYNRVETSQNKDTYSSQQVESISKASGIDATFMDNYNVLANLPSLTGVLQSTGVDTKNTYTFISNNTTHEPTLLDATNDYKPSMKVDNTVYDAEHANRFTINGETLGFSQGNNGIIQMRHYHVNVSSLLRLGEWFDHLKTQGVYDNTRIIVVSDHGRDIFQFTDFISGNTSLEYYCPLLLVKDFNASGKLDEDKTFMTNADVPTLAFEGVIANPVNPYTGKVINNSEKTAHPQFVIRGDSAKLVDGATFTASQWIQVQDDIWEKSNWKLIDEKVILKEHSYSK